MILILIAARSDSLTITNRQEQPCSEILHQTALWRFVKAESQPAKFIVGMCQTRAKGMANRGRDYRDYFIGTEVKTVY